MKKVSCVFLSLALVLLLIGCGANRKSAQSVVEDAIDAVKSADQSVATGYWGDGISNAETDESDAKMLKAMFGGISYNVISSEEKGILRRLRWKFQTMTLHLSWVMSLQNPFLRL